MLSLKSHPGTRIDFVYRLIKLFNRIFCSTGEKCYIFASVKQKTKPFKKYDYGTDYQLPTP